jgi:tRNA(Ile)-lysidine synthase
LILPGQTAELLSRCTFPPPQTPIDCAVSGGPDSLTLLGLAVAAGCEVTAYHCDHGLRDDSAAEAEIVAAAAERLGAGFVALAISCVDGPNLEARARAARVAALPEGVATGHTMDDQAETVLINLLRGAGIDGLAGMRAGARHPILGLRRSETVAYAEALGVEVVRDPSNVDSRFLRNRVRAELVPFLCELGGRDLVPVLARQADLLAEESALLDALADEIDPTDIAAMRAAPIALERRALRRFVREQTGTPYAPDADAIARLVEVVAGVRLAAQVPGGARIARSRGRLVFDPPTDLAR